MNADVLLHKSTYHFMVCTPKPLYEADLLNSLKDKNNKLMFLFNFAPHFGKKNVTILHYGLQIVLMKY